MNESKEVNEIFEPNEFRSSFPVYEFRCPVCGDKIESYYTASPFCRNDHCSTLMQRVFSNVAIGRVDGAGGSPPRSSVPRKRE